MIGKRGNFSVMAPGAFKQLEIRRLFPFDLLKKKIVGYADLGVIWVLFEEGESIVKVPFARNRKWFDAIMSEPEFSALGGLRQIYII